MLKILFDRPKTNDPMRVLSNDENLFHEAAHYSLRGEQFFQVKNVNGPDFYMSYILNSELLPPLPMITRERLLPPFYTYDENYRDGLYLEMLNDYPAVMFEEIEECSIVIARIALEFTDCEVYFNDSRILWFIPAHKRLHIVEQLPNYKEINAILCPKEIAVGSAMGDYRRTSSVVLFRDIFVLQFITEKDISKVKYIKLAMGDMLGIGGVLSHYSRIRNSLEHVGWQTLVEEGSTRYSDDMLRKYFTISMDDQNAVPDNTEVCYNTTVLTSSYLEIKAMQTFDDSIFNERFHRELDEYYEAIIAGKKTLGILIRGTDYVSTKLPGMLQMASVDDMLPMIREWMDTKGYEQIFLATEDQDILDRMKAEFGSKLRAIAQERYHVSDFNGNDVIADLEKQRYIGEDYNVALEDATVNYMYALYLLARSDGFMASGMCNGVIMANAFNKKPFQDTYVFQIGVK